MPLSVSITQDLAEPHAIRRSVFIEEQGFTDAEEWDDLDAQAVQLVIRDSAATSAPGNGPDDAPTAIATARLLRDGSTGKIGRIAVLKSHRGQGLGAALVRFGIAHFRETPGITRVYLSAQDHALPFYESLGFNAYGPGYLDGTVPHRDMELTL